jgi:hypothetical protein
MSPAVATAGKTTRAGARIVGNTGKNTRLVPRSSKLGRNPAGWHYRRETAGWHYSTGWHYGRETILKYANNDRFTRFAQRMADSQDQDFATTAITLEEQLAGGWRKSTGSRAIEAGTRLRRAHWPDRVFQLLDRTAVRRTRRQPIHGLPKIRNQDGDDGPQDCLHRRHSRQFVTDDQHTRF